MATDYFSWTVPMREADIPHNLAPDGGGLPDEVAHAMGRPDAVCTCSRNDWLHAMLLSIFRKLGGPTLDFLVKDPESLPNIDIGAFCQVPIAGSPIHYQEVWVVTKLPHANLLAAGHEIDAWLKRIAEEPTKFHDLFGECCEAEEVAKAIDESVDLRMDGVLTEGGDFATYLFCFLKALQAVFQEAWELNSAIVHARCTYVFRTFAAA